MRCFSPLELMGMVLGSTTTTMPVTSCCSSNSAVVMTGTMSSASLSSPDSSATTTSRRLDENTALYASGCISEGVYVSVWACMSWYSHVMKYLFLIFVDKKVCLHNYFSTHSLTTYVLYVLFMRGHIHVLLV